MRIRERSRVKTLPQPVIEVGQLSSHRHEQQLSLTGLSGNHPVVLLGQIARPTPTQPDESQARVVSRKPGLCQVAINARPDDVGH